MTEKLPAATADDELAIESQPEIVSLIFVRRDGTHGWRTESNGPEVQPPYPNDLFIGRYDPDGDPQWAQGWPLPNVYVRVTEEFWNRWLTARDTWAGLDEEGNPIVPPPLLPTAADVLEPSVY